MTWSIHTTDGFWHVFGSMRFLQLEDEKIHELKKNFSLGLSWILQDEARNQNR